MRATIRKFILAVNYTIVVVICLVLVTSTQIPLFERAVFGFGAIFAGIGVRWLVKMLMPLAEDQLDRTDA